jgi:hypothetical protein
MQMQALRVILLDGMEAVLSIIQKRIGFGTKSELRSYFSVLEDDSLPMEG